MKYWHPNITASYKANVAAPSSHPLVHANFAGARQWLLRTLQCSCVGQLSAVSRSSACTRRLSSCGRLTVPRSNCRPHAGGPREHRQSDPQSAEQDAARQPPGHRRVGAVPGAAVVRAVPVRGVAWRGVAWRMARTAFVVAVAVRVRRAMNARRTEVPAAATRANGGSATVKYWHPNITASYKANVSAPSAHPPVHANFTGAQLCWAVRCGAVRCGAVRCGVVWCGVVCSAAWRGSMHLCVRVCGGPNRDCWMDAQTSCRRTTRISTA